MLRKAVPAALIVAAALASASQARPARDAERIPLPAGLQPEGIAAGPGDSLYVGSIPTGDVLRLDASSGATKTVVDAEEGSAAIGVEVDGKRLVVAGGPTGRLTVYDRRSGKLLTGYGNNDNDTFVNDVTRQGNSYWATDSRQPVLYRITRNLRNAGEVELSGIPYRSEFNLNGIEAVGDQLVAVHSDRGELYRIDPETFATDEIDLGGAKVKNGDGLFAVGRTLYVVQNQDNRIAAVKLNGGLTRGRVTTTITSSEFDVPTTLTRAGGDFFALNARFGTEDPESADYWVTRFR